MKKNKQIEPRPFLSYIDEATDLDFDLEMLGQLSEAASDEYVDDAVTLRWVGERIKKHIKHHKILRHKYFGELLDCRTKSFLEDERLKLRAAIKRPRIEKKKRANK